MFEHAQVREHFNLGKVLFRSRNRHFYLTILNGILSRHLVASITASIGNLTHTDLTFTGILFTLIDRNNVLLLHFSMSRRFELLEVQQTGKDRVFDLTYSFTLVLYFTQCGLYLLIG